MSSDSGSDQEGVGARDGGAETAVSGPPDAPSPLIGAVLADRYRVEELLGEGGMGAVFRAEHIHMRKPVAIKVLHREMTMLDEVVKRFEREAIAAGRIQHPNVVVATDFGKLDDGAFYLVLEYVPGRSLRQVLDEDGAMPPERALVIARQIASALSAAHDAGIVHRDLKPDNILLIDRGGIRDFVKVLDFGIAKVMNDPSGDAPQLTRLGSVFGTPQYMAPEQAAGRPVDQRADLYALGLILYEMLAGRPTFSAEEIVALLAKQMTQAPDPLPEDVPVPVAELAMALLEKEPGSRLQTADDVAARIDAFLGPDSGVPSSATMARITGVGSRGAGPSIAGEAAPGASGREGEESSGSRGPLRTALSSVVEQQWALRARELVTAPIAIAGREVPMGRVGAAVGVVLLGTVVGAGLFTSCGDTNAQMEAAADQAKPPEEQDPLQKILSRAQGGSPDAVKELEERDERSRSALEWFSLAKGRIRLRRVEEGLEAYRRALQKDSSHAEDAFMVRALRNAAEAPETAAVALEIAAEHLGEQGADLLFEVWAATSEKTPITEKAKMLLDSKKVRANASEALQVALSLREAKSCTDILDLLSRAREHGDERALRPLQKLTSTKGCGFLGLGDCYSCLRRGTELLDAIAAVQDRRAPRF